MSGLAINDIKEKAIADTPGGVGADKPVILGLAQKIFARRMPSFSKWIQDLPMGKEDQDMTKKARKKKTKAKRISRVSKPTEMSLE